MKKLLALLLLVPTLGFSANKFMVENVTGTNGCYLFQTTPTCATTIIGISSGSIASGSTFYIQNTLSPTTANQAFNVATASAALVSGSTVNVVSSLLLNSSQGTAGQFLTSQGPGLPPIYQTGASVLNTTNTFTGTNTFTDFVIPSSGIAGTTTNNDAVPGAVGEYITAQTAGATITDSIFNDLASIPLTPGDWDVTGVFANTPPAAGSTAILVGISTTTGDTQAGMVIGNQAVKSALPTTSTAVSSISIPDVRISLSTAKTVYLKALEQSTGAGNGTGTGRISARRRR